MGKRRPDLWRRTRHFRGQGRHHAAILWVIPVARAEIAVHDRLYRPMGWSRPHRMGQFLLGLRESRSACFSNERLFLAKVHVKASMGESRLSHEIVNAGSLDPGSAKLARRRFHNARMGPLLLLL
jgi:hypothetical protein